MVETSGMVVFPALQEGYGGYAKLEVRLEFRPGWVWIFFVFLFLAHTPLICFWITLFYVSLVPPSSLVLVFYFSSVFFFFFFKLASYEELFILSASGFWPLCKGNFERERGKESDLS